MSDYKHTLNLPRTDFPMKANLAEREPLILKRWQAADLYEQLRQDRRGRLKFILHDGPPYANARPHLGTAFNKIIKDIMVKCKSMAGYDAPFVPGWDCHGLPIELNVEQQFAKKGKPIIPADFRAACRAYAQEQMQLQREDFQRLGILADWQHPYLTMDASFEAGAVRVVTEMLRKGYVQRGQKPVYWCAKCQSALAEAEVEYANKTSTAMDVRFALIKNAHSDKLFAAFQVLQSVLISFPIWTTTPWTLPANQAVALNADVMYAVVLTQDADSSRQAFVIAEPLVAAAMQRYGIAAYEILLQLPGRDFAGLHLQHPLLASKQVPVILGAHVTTETGTGNVHTAPAHGLEDYQVGLQYQLPVESPVGADCLFHGEQIPALDGLSLFKADDIIREQLQREGHLLAAVQIQHSYPHCWRHKTPLIFRATPQWFVRLEGGLRADALAAVSRVQWIPEWGQQRMEGMLRDRPDWCISRQRLWGTPLPLLLHRETEQLHPNMVELLEKIADLIEHRGAAYWYEMDLREIIPADADFYRKVTDVLDVWFDSGVTHACVLEKRPELAWPADVYFEGSDQHRGWFQSSLLTGVALYGTAPYKQVLTHGYVLDDKGKDKMSKSKGNVIAPSDVVKRLGADVLRLWAASTDYRSDPSASDEILNRSAEAYRRIRNTARYLLANISDFSFSEHAIAFEEMLSLDRWIVAHAQQLQQRIIAAYEQFQFHQIYQLIHNFCTVELGRFYLDIIKDRQYTCATNSHPRRSAQTALYYLVEALVRWIAPILSFTAEEIWNYLPNRSETSVFLTTWYTGWGELPVDELEHGSCWEQLLPVRDEVNKALELLRNQGEIGSALDAQITLYADDRWFGLLNAMGEELRFVFITSEARVLPHVQAPSAAMSTACEGLQLVVEKTESAKCARCWQHRPDVGSHLTQVDLCGRCITNLSGQGEKRQWA